MRHIIKAMALLACLPASAQETPLETLDRLGLGPERESVRSLGRNLSSLEDYLDAMPERDRSDILLRRMEVVIRQTNVGAGVYGRDAAEVCTGEGCGTGRYEEEFCPESLCATRVPGCRATLHGDMCGFPEPDAIPGFDGKAALSYVFDSFSEVAVATYLGVGNEPVKSCSVTMIAPSWALAALHCFTLNELPKGFRGVEQLSPSIVLDGSDAPGWTRLKPHAAYPILLGVPEGSRSAVARHVHIPYAPDEKVWINEIGLAARDLAMIELRSPLDLPANAYPRFETGAWKPAPGQPVSFSGFGVTNAPGIAPRPPTGPFDAAAWKSRRLTAFNFLTSPEGDTQDGVRVIRWRQGTLGYNGGPCSKDSGGPVYAGFDRGYWDDPTILVGVVSALYGASSGTASDCTDPKSRGTAILLTPFLGGICEIAGNTPRGCERVER